MAAVAGQVRERLGHERGDQAALLGERFDHVAKEDRAVAGRQRVGVLEVLLELAVGVLVVGGVVVPPQRGDGLGNLGDEVEVSGQRAHVVAGLVERVAVIGDLDSAVLGPAHEEVLEFGADLQLISLVGGAARALGAGSCAGNTATASPSTVTSHANRATVGRQGRIVSVSGRASRPCRGRGAPARCRRPRTRQTPRLRSAGRRGGARAQAWRSACRACRRTARTGTRCPGL